MLVDYKPSIFCYFAVVLGSTENTFKLHLEFKTENDQQIRLNITIDRYMIDIDYYTSKSKDRSLEH